MSTQSIHFGKNEDQIVDVCKALWRLKNKSEVINRIIMEYAKSKSILKTIKEKGR